MRYDLHPLKCVAQARYIMAMSSSKKTLLMMIFVFVAPIVIGAIMFLNADNLKMGSSTVNYGQLITPPVLIDVKGIQVDNQAADVEKTAREKWTLLYLTPEVCDEKCSARIDLLKRLRLVTNENMRRIRTLAVFPQAPANQEKLQFDNPDLVIGVRGEDSSAFMAQFPKQDENPVYLIDPIGNLMMYYSGDTPDIKRMLKDLKRILKYSHIG